MHKFLINFTSSSFFAVPDAITFNSVGFGFSLPFCKESPLLDVDTNWLSPFIASFKNTEPIKNPSAFLRVSHPCRLLMVPPQHVVPLVLRQQLTSFWWNKSSQRQAWHDNRKVSHFCLLNMARSCIILPLVKVLGVGPAAVHPKNNDIYTHSIIKRVLKPKSELQSCLKQEVV